jgi:hypothetical protein
MRVCSGIKANGERCRAQPMRDSEWCLNHHPDRAEKNRRRSSRGGRRGGRGRPTTELKRLQERFEELAEQVLKGDIPRADGAVAGQLLNGARACIRDLLAACEQEEMVERLEALEEALERQKAKRYGA